MNDVSPLFTGTDTAVLPHVGSTIPASPERKALELAVVKRGAKDFLNFLDETKELFFGYLYHRTGSVESARTILGEIYIDTLGRAMSFIWFGKLNTKLLFDAADTALKNHEATEADIDSVYLQNLPWLDDNARRSVATLHDALWSLPKEAQRLIILSLLMGMPESSMAEATGLQTEQISQNLPLAQDLLLQRWEPIPDVVTKLSSLVFVPSLDIQSETTLRFSVVEKYNALRFRRYQWVVIGGLFAVMSNVIVASVLAFVVITTPPSSLRGTKSSVASLDATLLKRQMTFDRAKESVTASYEEAQKLAAYSAARGLTQLGLSSAMESLKDEQAQEEKVNGIIRTLQSARTAMAPVLSPVVRLAMAEWGRF
jgi:DNA-directed RNA polymerase specialized sigma24 family protein